MILIFQFDPPALALMNDYIEVTQTFSRSLIVAVLLGTFASAVSPDIITLPLAPDIIALLQQESFFSLTSFCH
jgi:hypothetical protein